MHFIWSTMRAGRSGRFGQGSLSTFAVASINYPKGYTVTISGGRVVSAPNSSTLVVSQSGDPATASVTVAPR